MLPDGWLTDEPPRPALLDRLQARLAEDPSVWRAALRDAEARAVTWRWAHPHASIEPLRVETLWGRRTRWLDRRPLASWNACHAGADAQGRLVLVRDPGAFDGAGERAGDLLTIIERREGHVTTWEVHPTRGLTTVSCWEQDESGRITEGVEAGPDRSWRSVRFTYEGDRIVAVDEVWWFDEAGYRRRGGWSRSDVRYDDQVRLSEIASCRSVDGATTVDFRAKPLSPRGLAEELGERLREGVLEALRRIDAPGEVGAIGLVYDTFGRSPPVLVVDRTDRFADAEGLMLDDASPLEWGAPDGDAVDLGRLGAWPAIDEDRPRALHRAVRAYVQTVDRTALQALLGAARPPVLLAMDTEREHARQNLADAFGQAAARRILRRGARPSG